jgi:hypothetical protein
MSLATYNARPARFTAPGLPELCYGLNLSDNAIIIIRRGVSGYYLTDYGKGTDAVVDTLNARQGVTKAQREAMEAGSMFGWHVPAADPKTWERD